MNDYRFQVNLGGMIEILSDHLYSSPDVYIRELLQNGVDAITAREIWEKEQTGRPAAGQGEGACRDASADRNIADVSQGTIVLEIEEGRSLVFSDNGQGLTEEEIHQFLAVIGESSKRNPRDGRIRTDYIGRFGIGLLSCFMVADEIRMRTRSCKGNSPVLEWSGKPDGIYTIKELPQASLGRLLGDADPTAQASQGADAGWDMASGTQVILEAKPGREDYFTEKVIRKLLTYYGLLLPFPVIVRVGAGRSRSIPAICPGRGERAISRRCCCSGR